MTSQDSFNFQVYRHAFRQALGQGVGVALVSFALLLLLVPVSTAGVPGFSIFNIEYTHNQMLFRFFHENVQALVNIAVILIGFSLGIALFKFLLEKRTSDAYFSLGITRAKLFLANFAAGVLLVFLVVLLPFVLSLVLNIIAFAQLGSLALMLNSFAYLATGFLILALVSFSLAALSCCLVGTISEAMTFAAALTAIPSILFYGTNCLTKHLLLGNPYGLSPSTTTVQISQGLIWQLSSLNPVLFFYKSSEAYASGYVHLDHYVLPPMNYNLLAGWAAMIVVFVCLAVFFLRQRRAEIAGIAGKNKIMSLLSAGVLSFLSFCLVVNVAADISIPGSLGSGLLACAIVFLVSERLLLPRREKLFKKLIPMFFVLVLVLLFAVILDTGGLGYSSRVPEVSTVKSVEMSYVGSPNYLNAKNSGVSNGKSYYIMSSYSFNTTQDVKKVTDLHKKIIQAGKGKLELAKTVFHNTTVPYDIILRYTLKDGQSLVRYYDRTTLETLAQLLAVDDTDKVKQSTLETIQGTAAHSTLYWAPGAYKEGDIYLSDSWYTNPHKVVLDPDLRKQLLACIAEDVQNQPVEDRYFPQAPPLGVIMFTRDSDNEEMSFAYSLENALVYVTEDFSHTLAFLKQNNLDQYFDFKGQLESVTFQKYDPYIGVVNKRKTPLSQYFLGYILKNGYQFVVTKDFGKDLVVDDPDRLRELTGLLRNDYFMSDGGYLASAKIKGTGKYVYKFLPQKDAPAYVAKSGESGAM